MITRNDLEAYKKLNSVIADLAKELDYLEENKPEEIFELGKVRGSQSESPYCERSFTVSGIDEKAAKAHADKYNELKRKYEYELEEQCKKKIDIEMFFSCIKDTKKRLILKDLYENNMTQVEVAEKYGFSQPRITQIITECIDNFNKLNE